MKKEAYDGFLRQRRNLMVMNLVLILYYTADLEFTRFNLLGNEITIGNPLAAPVILWIILIYWFIRYFQYFLELDDRSYRKKFSDTYDFYISRHYTKKINSDPVELERLGKFEGRQRVVKAFGINSYNSESMWAKFEYTYFITHMRSGDVEALNKRVSKMVEIEGMEIMPIYLWSMFSGIFLTTYFSEYILPIILFLVAAVLAVIL